MKKWDTTYVWERVLDVFSNNGQCTLIEPLRVMTVIHCQSGEQFNQVWGTIPTKDSKLIKEQRQTLKYWC